MIEKGDFDGAIYELYEVIKKLKFNFSKKRNLAEAYYLLAKVYKIVGMKKEFDYNLKMAFKVYPNLSIEESDPELQERIDIIKAEFKQERVIPKEGKKKKNLPGFFLL